MRTLIVEDDLTSRILLKEVLKKYGPCDLALNGQEAVDAVSASLKIGEPYDLITLDIMMPGMDGQEALKQIRTQEQSSQWSGMKPAKIVMTTALDDPSNQEKASLLCDTYLVKPLRKDRLVQTLSELGLA